MATRTIDTLAAVLPYNKQAILDRTTEVKIYQKKDMVYTEDKGKVLSCWKPSSIYELVNFNDAVQLLLSNIDNIFNPEYYNITVKGGYQELKLRGKQHVINGDVHHEMVWLTNSSNGSRRLSVRYGLMRQICSNGAVVTVKGSSFTVKHLTKNNVNEELKAFMETLPKLSVGSQVKTLKKIGDKTITIGKLSDAIVNKIGKEGNNVVWDMLAAKLISSKTDRLGDKYDAAITGIKVPFTQLTNETLDIEIPAWNVFNCFTEISRSLDAPQIERETNKILEVLLN